MGNDKNFSLRPSGGNRANTIAGIIKGSVWLFWISGLAIGIIAGKSAGELQNALGYSYYSYGKSSGSGFSWGIAFLVWYVTFAIGIWQYAFAEIISLLQGISTTGYDAKFADVGSVSEQMDGEINKSRPVKAGDEMIYDFDLKQKGVSTPFRLNKLKVYEGNGEVSGRLIVEGDNNIQPESIFADIEFNTIFGYEYKYTLEGICFVNFVTNSHYESISDRTMFDIPDAAVESFEDVYIEVKKYILNGKARIPGDMPAEEIHIDVEENLEAEADFTTPQIEPKETVGHVCPKCGKEIENSEAMFCPFCGEKLNG